MTIATIYRKKSLAAYIDEMESVSGPRATLTLATPGGGAEWQLQGKRLENLLQKLGNDSALRERYGKAVDAVIAQARGRLEDASEWSGDYQAICLHAWPRGCHFWKLRTPVPEKAVMGESFCYKEMAHEVESSFDGLVLHLALKDPALYRVKGARVVRLKGESLPQSIYELSEREVVDGGQQAHVRSAGANRAPDMVRQSSGSKESTRDLNEPAYLRDISHVLGELSGSDQLPLVVIGDERLVSSFAAAYSHGSFQRVTNASAHPDEREVSRICHRLASAAADAKLAQLRGRLESADTGSDLYSDNLKEIFEGARQGRVSLCAVAGDVSVHSEYDKAHATLTAVEPDSACHAVTDILDRILVETVTKDGNCIVVPQSDLPEGKRAIGVYKW